MFTLAGYSSMMEIVKYTDMFFVFQIWRDIYLFSIAVLSALVVFVQFHPRYFSVHWFKQRMAVYVGLVAYGVIPASHWFVLNGGWEAEIVRVC